MMRAIHKQALTGMECALAMPASAVILAVQYQGDVPCIWYECDDESELVPRRFSVYGTGWPLPDSGITYIATIQSGPFVWHVWEVVK